MFSKAKLALLTCTILSAAPALKAEQAPAEADVVRISTIYGQPYLWENRLVVVEGMVDRIRNASDSDISGFFFLRDAYGTRIRIRTSAATPDQRVLYRIRGTVTIDGRGSVFLAEESRSAIPLAPVEGFMPATHTDQVVLGTAVKGTAEAAQTTISGVVSKPKKGSMSLLTILTGGLAIGLLLGVALQFIRTHWAGGAAASQLAANAAAANSSKPSGLATTVPSFAPTYSNAKPAHNGTVRVLPVWLEVEGPNPRPIRFFGATPGGRSEITFGRDVGDPYAHVQLNERTVSRQQARLIIANGQYAIENLSDTNPTVVNDRPLSLERVPLHDGDQVRMGEVVMRFRDRQTVAC